MRRHFTHPATVISLLALLLAAGGPVYGAASRLLDGSRIAPRTIGTTQLKANAVTSAQVKNNSLALSDLTAATRSAIATTTIADGSVTAAKIASGAVVAPGATLPSGITLRGVLHVHSACNAGGCSMGAGTSESFGGYTFPNAPAAYVLEAGAAPTTQCPGSATNPQAASGSLCIYVRSTPAAGSQLLVYDESSSANAINYNVDSNVRTPSGTGGASPWGFGFAYSMPSGVSNVAQLHATWAATS